MAPVLLLLLLTSCVKVPVQCPSCCWRRWEEPPGVSRGPGRLWWTGSEGALQEAAASAAGRTLVLPAEPVHHVARVAAVAAAQAEVGGAAHGHVADGALEGEALAGRALRPAGLTAAVAAVQAELWGWREETQDRSENLSLSLSLSLKVLKVLTHRE